MATRHTMDDAYRGGRVNPDAKEDKPKRLRYPCFAEGCPMPGTIFTGSTGAAGSCAWHYGVLPTDIPKVTERLNAWGCVADEINAARRVLTGDKAADPKAQDDHLATAWLRLGPLVELSGWASDLEPHPRERLGDWSRRLEWFIGARVVEVLSTHRRRAA